jgi:hypothetical protein
MDLSLEIPLNQLPIQRMIFWLPMQYFYSRVCSLLWVFRGRSGLTTDHTRYFSQMIISFRRMAIDLISSLLFIVVFFTGFFVAFSVTFGKIAPRALTDTKRGEFIQLGQLRLTFWYFFLLNVLTRQQIFFGFQLPAWQTIHCIDYYCG